MTSHPALPSGIEVVTFSPRRTNCCVMVGLLNEGERFTQQLSRMSATGGCPDIIIADGGSTDGATAAERISEKVHAIIIDRRRHGLSGQYRSALAYALGQGYQSAIMIDGNGKDGVEALPDFVRALEEGADFIQGSRFLSGGSHRNTPWLRYLGIRLFFNPLMWIASGFLYTDGINGFKGISRRALEHPDMQPFRDEFKGYSLQYYFNYRAPRLGLKVMEVPVARDYPDHGVPTKIHGPRAYLRILKELCSACAGCYNPR